MFAEFYCDTEEVKILILGNYPPPYGGVPVHVEALVKRFAALGHVVGVICGGRINSTDKNIANVSIYRMRSLHGVIAIALGYLLLPILLLRAHTRAIITSVGYYNSSRSLGVAIVASSLVLMARKSKPDLIVGQNAIFYGFPCFFISNLFKIPYALSIYGEFYSIAVRGGYAESFFRKILDQSIFSYSCSSHCARSVESISANVVEPIIYGVDKDFFETSISRINGNFEHLGQEKVHQKRIIYVGRFTWELGFYFFLDLAEAACQDKRFANYRFCIAGQKGPGSHDARFKSMRAEGIVEVFENISSSELAGLYYSASVLVVPSLNQRACSSLVAMESMLYGVQVIGFDSGGIPEILNPVRHSTCVQKREVRSLLDYILVAVGKLESAGSMVTKDVIEDARNLFGNDAAEIVITRLITRLNNG